jgi:dimethylargininase
MMGKVHCVFTRAIVRPPSKNFADGLTTVELGKPDYELALEQHEIYCRALEHCGLSLTRLAADERYPDSTFVEDTAIVTERGAVIARPGAVSRLGEIEQIKSVLRDYYPQLREIRAPGTLDGGDVCEAGDNFFIGVSHRTNEDGAQQLAALLAEFGYGSTLIDIRGLSNILHLKSGLAYLGGKRLLVIDDLKELSGFSDYELVNLESTEAYAANCLLINDRVFVASGFPRLRRELETLDYETVVLEMSEFQKMDGGLSCLSLRF